jgi:hypothetical protein
VGSLIHGYDDPTLVELDIIEELVAHQSVSPVVAYLPDITADLGCYYEIWSGAQPSPYMNVTVPARAMGQNTMYCGMRQLPYWGSPYANTINGSTGSVFAPRMHEVDSFHLYVSNLRRSVLLDYTGADSLNGIALRQYRLAGSAMESAAVNPNNAAFAMAEAGFFPKPPVATLNVTSELFSAFSKPYYLDGSMDHVKVVMPRAPSRSLDDTYQSIEPYSGTLCKVFNRLQLNVRLRPVSGVQGMVNAADTWLPVFTTEEWMILPDDLQNDIKTQLLLPLRAGVVSGAVLCAVGALVIVVAATVFLRRRFCGGKGDERRMGSESYHSHVGDEEERAGLVQRATQ